MTAETPGEPWWHETQADLGRHGGQQSPERLIAPQLRSIPRPGSVVERLVELGRLAQTSGDFDLASDIYRVASKWSGR